MSRNNETQTQTFFKSGAIQLLLALASVATTLLAFYISSMLQPLVKTDELMNMRVAAIESDYSRKSIMETELKYINEKLDNINTKLDKALGY